MQDPLDNKQAKRPVVNTTAETPDHIWEEMATRNMPAGYVVGPKAIEKSEAVGQRQLVESDTLPVRMSPSRQAFEAQGFVFGAVVKGDPLFIAATLPEGWKKEGTDHSMWSKIVDQTGKERVSIFYKAAFYDRSAFMTLTSDED